MPTEPRGFDEAKRHAVYLRDSSPEGYRCVYSSIVDKTCTGKGWSLDHIKPIHLGGALQAKRDEPGHNLVAAFGVVNSSKQDRTKAEWSEYAKGYEPPKGGLKFDWKEIEKKAKEPLDLKRGAELAKLAKQARAARGLNANGERVLETKKSKAIADKARKIVEEHHAERAAKAEKKTGPGVRHGDDGRFEPGDAKLPPVAPIARYVKPGEALAIAPGCLHQSAGGDFFWLVHDGAPKVNERHGDVAVIHIRGELEHHLVSWSRADSYEGIREKFREAFSGEDVTRAHRAEACARYGVIPDDYQPIDATPPRKVVVCIDSPGGVVAGLNETQAAILEMKRAAKIPVIVFVNEMAASAAYALATVGDRIICPRSAIVGSVGVISTMISQYRKNKEDGYDVELITSGARKADGHLHAPLSAAAIDVERGRVTKLADAFFEMVSKARRLPVAKIRAMNAGIYLGEDAVRVGLADAVGSLESVLAEGAPKPRGPAGGGNQTDRRLRPSVKPVDLSSNARSNGMKLSAKIAVLVGALATASDPVQRTKLSLAIARKGALLAAKAEDGDDDPDDEGGDEDDEDESKAAKATEKAEKAKKAAEAAKHRAKKAEYLKKAEESEEAAKMAEADDEEEESEEAKAKLATAGHDALLASLAASVKKLEASAVEGSKAALIKSARDLRAITKAEGAWLATVPLAQVETFLAMRAKGGLVVTDEEHLVKARHAQPGTEESLPDETRDMIAKAVDVWQGDKKSYREALVKAHLEQHAKQLSAAAGAPGRY